MQLQSFPRRSLDPILEEISPTDHEILRGGGMSSSLETSIPVATVKTSIYRPSPTTWGPCVWGQLPQGWATVAKGVQTGFATLPGGNLPDISLLGKCHYSSHHKTPWVRAKIPWPLGAFTGWFQRGRDDLKRICLIQAMYGCPPSDAERVKCECKWIVEALCK